VLDLRSSISLYDSAGVVGAGVEEAGECTRGQEAGARVKDSPMFDTAEF
jgi:hypothetical protein